MAHPYLTGTRSPRVLAHRGLVTAEAAAAGVAENSFAAVAAAQAAGAEYIESDCHLTADGIVVLFHDSTLARVTGDPRPLSDVTAIELETLMAERGGMITLAQALESFPRTRFNIDVKADAAAEPAGRILATASERVLVTSFSDSRRLRALQAARERGPEVLPATSAGQARMARILAAVRVRARDAQRRLFADIDALQIPERMGPVRVLTPALVRAAHEHGVEIHVWTVNDAATMTRLVSHGVDGVVTDRADVALGALDARG